MGPLPLRFHRLIVIAWALALVATTIWAGTLAFRWVDRPFNGFFVQPMLYVSPYQHDSWNLAGLEPVDVIRAVEGRPVRDTAALVEAARAVPVGTPLRYEVMRGDRVFERAVPTRLFTLEDYVRIFGFQVVLGWSFLLIALALFWLRPEVPAARAMALLSTALGLVFVLYVDFQTEARMILGFNTVYALMGPAFCGLALYFPRRSPRLVRWPWLLYVTILVGVAAVVGFHAFTLGEGPAFVSAERYDLALATVYVSNLAIALGLVAAIGAIVLGFCVAPKGSLARRQAGVALFGAGLGLVPSLAWAAPMAFGVNSPVPLRMALVWLLLFPISVAFAIVRARLFDIAVVLRNSVLYLILSALLLVVYVGVAAAARLLLPGQGLVEDLVATAFVVTLFVLLRDRLQAWLDRRLFRMSYDAQLAMEEASRSMTTLLDREQIVERLRRAVGGTMHPASEEVYMRDEAGGFRPVVDPAAPPLPEDHPLVAALAEQRSMRMRAPEGDALFAGLGEAEVAVPLCFEDRLQGVWLLGPKRAETAYTGQDRRLLMTLAHQSAIALANAAAYERLRRFNTELEERVAERTRALELAQAKLVQTEKMSALGQLVAGVAHELNNPVTFLVSGVELLEERLADGRAIMEAEAAGASPEALAALRERLGAETLEEEIQSLLASCKEGADRARAIVQGLRDFSRLDDFGKEAVALGPCVETTVPMVAASFRDRVRLEVALNEVPEVEGSAIHLKQVVLNLLVNACQAIADRGVVKLSLRPHADGVALSVEDDGAGMSAEVRSRLFEPFYTTKPPGEGTGLGLAICHGIVTAHGGRIEVESEPGRGSTFRVILPAGSAVKEGVLADAADRR